MGQPEEILGEHLKEIALEPGMGVRFEVIGQEGYPKEIEGILTEAQLPYPNDGPDSQPGGKQQGYLLLRDAQGRAFSCDFGWSDRYYKSQGQGGYASIHYSKAYILPSPPFKPRFDGNVGFLGAPQLTVGADPEIFGVDAKGHTIPAWEWLGPKKSNSKHFWDGFQGEFITQPGGCLDVQSDNISASLHHLQERLSEKFPGARLEPVSVVELTPQQLSQCSDEHIGLGCTPSLNAYGEPQLSVENPRELPIRFAGGHMHFGITQAPPNFAKNSWPRVVKTMDAIAGMCGVSLAAQWDDPRRRQFYGRAGEYRLPKHGLEYRVHSNFWLRDPRLYYLIWDLTRWAWRLGWLGLGEHWQASEDEVRLAINETQPGIARAILRRNEKMLSYFLARRYGDASLKYTLSVLLDGREVIPTKGTDLLQAWEANKGWNMRWYRHAERTR
jgi:hypothetical protein